MVLIGIVVGVVIGVVAALYWVGKQVSDALGRWL
jgi:gas vesicle protein